MSKKSFPKGIPIKVDGVQYTSVSEAGRKCGVDHRNLHKYATGKETIAWNSIHNIEVIEYKGKVFFREDPPADPNVVYINGQGFETLRAGEKAFGIPRDCILSYFHWGYIPYKSKADVIVYKGRTITKKMKWRVNGVEFPTLQSAADCYGVEKTYVSNRLHGNCGMNDKIWEVVKL